MSTKNVFFDSNVILGFCFAGTDKWGSAAVAAMETSDVKYTSKGVWRECFGDEEKDGRAHTMHKKLRYQVLAFCRYLRDNGSNDLYNLSDGGEIPDKMMKFSLLLESIKKEIKQGGTVNELWAKTLLSHIEDMLLQAKSKLKEQLKFHDRRAPYTDLYKELSNEITNRGIDLDKDDLEIILDAHDLAITVERLILVTADKKHIVKATQIIRKLTKIYNVCYLEKFSRA